jgi:uncharacterized membrane protein
LQIKKNIPLKSSWEWIKNAFYTFRESPIHFILLSVLSTLAGFLPLFGAFMGPLFIARFAHIAKKVESGQKITLAILFSDFFSNITLVRLGFLNFTLSTIILLGQYFIEMYVKNLGYDVTNAQIISLITFVLPLLILQISMWIAPIICLNHPEIRPVKAMIISIKIGLYNFITLICYTLLAMVFTILAVLPLGLGLFVWIPIMSISSFYVYKTIFER